ncbi:DUF1471 domain-containing protein [Enterobacteriaceae bacterium H11S18]|uniref:DUF1471 domain-containing protein n=1 Tax=Enterobacteriaceae TaxID=543 RepID=UPI0019256BF5|nr:MULTISPECIES: DUF1471 domain-containing protein [Enterobacteriaceae]MCT4712581.1 DUF1471 domain-containing protein [Dryocola clanedunensis]
MKNLIRDIMAIFTPGHHGPVILQDGLTEEEKSALVPVRTLSIDWVASADELEREAIRETLDAGAAGYQLSNLEQTQFIHARATLYSKPNERH